MTVRYRVVGECPVVVGGQEWRPQSLIGVEVPADTAVFLQRIGAIVLVPPPPITPQPPAADEQE